MYHPSVYERPGLHAITMSMVGVWLVVVVTMTAGLGVQIELITTLCSVEKGHVSTMVFSGGVVELLCEEDAAVSIRNAVRELAQCPKWPKVGLHCHHLRPQG